MHGACTRALTTAGGPAHKGTIRVVDLEILNLFLRNVRTASALGVALEGLLMVCAPLLVVEEIRGNSHFLQARKK
jgi:hypothetical protein